MRLTITAQDLAPNALRRWAEVMPDEVLVEHVDGRRATWSEVCARNDAWAAAMHARGHGRGTVVGIFVDDNFDGALAWLAITASGQIAVPVNTAHVGRMLQHVLRTSAMTVIVVSPGLLDRLDGLLDASSIVEVVVVGHDAPAEIDGRVASSSEDLLAAPAPPVEPWSPDLHDIAMYLYTSGSTGPAKAVVVPWAASHSHWSATPGDALGVGDALYAPMPMFHNSGIGALQLVVWKGGRIVVRPKFSATAFWEEIRRFDVTVAGLVGPMTAVLWSQPERDDDADNPLQSIVLGPMIEQMEEFEARFGVRVCTMYGMTEVPSMIATGWDHGPWQNSGVVCEGWPWPEVMLVDEHDREVPDGVVGELVVRTRAPWALNAGYLGDPEATADAWRNGWFHTGDALRRDPEGRYHFVDRMKDTIRRRGENISSYEVESVVIEHPDVEQCAAFGVPDGFGGDEVMIAVIPVAGATVDVAALLAHLDAELPAYAVPRFVDVVEDLPRNSTTLRVQKFVLRDRGVTPTTVDRRDLVGP